MAAVLEHNDSSDTTQFSLFDSSKSDSSSLHCDEVASTITDVTESLGMVSMLCGVEVTMDFLNDINSILRQHLYTYRVVMDREAEIGRVNR